MFSKVVPNPSGREEAVRQKGRKVKQKVYKHTSKLCEAVLGHGHNDNANILTLSRYSVYHVTILV